MEKTLALTFPYLERPILAEILSESEPQMSELLWNSLPRPERMICQHTLSTGDYFQISGRPPRHPVALGSQATPVGGSRKLLCDLKPGDILYAGGRELAVAWGPSITEPLMARGPVVARVVPGSLEDLRKAGRGVWEAQYLTHRVVVVTLSREER